MHASFDRSNFFIHYREKSFKMLVCYVDDIVLFSENKENIQTATSRFKNYFEIRIEQILRELYIYIVDYSIPICFFNKTIFDRLLCVCKMTKCEVAKTPLQMRIDLCTAGGNHLGGETQYCQLIRSLQHLANTLRLEIFYVIGYLSHFVTRPTTQLRRAAR